MSETRVVLCDDKTDIFRGRYPYRFALVGWSRGQWPCTLETIYQWCIEHFGETDTTGPNRRYFVSSDGCFFFEDAEHAVEFRIRWC